MADGTDSEVHIWDSTPRSRASCSALCASASLGLYFLASDVPARKQRKTQFDKPNNISKEVYLIDRYGLDYWKILRTPIQ